MRLRRVLEETSLAVSYYPDAPKWMEYSLIILLTAVIAVGVVIVTAEAIGLRCVMSASDAD